MVPEKLKKYVENFEGKNKGRYHIMYMTLINIVGGDDLRKECQKKFGRDQYLPDEMYPTREGARMVIHAVEKGVPAERLGRMLAQTYARSNPDLLKVLNRDNAIESLIAAYDAETDFAGTGVKIRERRDGYALIARNYNPMPCDFFKGAILGLFDLLEIPCEVNETKCQWKGQDQACVYEVKWK